MKEVLSEVESEIPLGTTSKCKFRASPDWHPLKSLYIDFDAHHHYLNKGRLAIIILLLLCLLGF